MKEMKVHLKDLEFFSRLGAAALKGYEDLCGRGFNICIGISIVGIGIVTAIAIIFLPII